MLKIALFGTSADPPTWAHKDILQWLGDRYDRVVVWAADNPFKANQTPLEHRQGMLKLLVNQLKGTHPQIEHHPELSFPYTLYSVDTARQRWPQAEFSLVVGTDILAKLPHWYRVKDLLAQVNLLILQRPGVHISADIWQQVAALSAKMEMADYIGPAVSSTACRQGESSVALIPAIAAYIHQKNLYPSVHQ